MNIVIADDDQNLLAMLVPHLEHLGHRVALLPDGAALLEKLKEVRADLIISDINMPGFDGLELYARTRAMPEYAASPFILWSGLEAEKGRALAKKDAKLRFLRKPFSLAALQKAMEELSDMPLFGDYEGRTGRQGLKF